MDGSEAASARARKVVLVVDDDPGTVRVLANGIDGVLRQFEVLTAHDGREAVEILERRPIDAIVTDLGMPIMDGFELIAHVTTRSEPVPIVVLSGLASNEIDERLRPYGGLRVLGKPEGFRNIGDVLDELLDQIGPGRLEGIALSSVVQLIEAERRSCTLIVTSRRRKGRLYFESGRLINAFSDDFGADGEAAAYDILGWDDTAIAFEALPDDVRREIHTPLQLMLIEVATVQDQLRERTERSIPPAPAGAPGVGRPLEHVVADQERQSGVWPDIPGSEPLRVGVDGDALAEPAVAHAASADDAAREAAAQADAADEGVPDDYVSDESVSDEAVAHDAMPDEPDETVADGTVAGEDAGAWTAAEDASHDAVTHQTAATETTGAVGDAVEVGDVAAGAAGDAAFGPAHEEVTRPGAAADDAAEAPLDTHTVSIAEAEESASDPSSSAAVAQADTDCGEHEHRPRAETTAAMGADGSPESNTHVTRLVAAVERLTQRARDADTVLTALTDEIESFRLAQQHFDEENARRERRCQELEAFRNDVARLARQILGRVDALFLSRPGAEATALDDAAATVEAMATAAASAATDGDPSARSP